MDSWKNKDFLNPAVISSGKIALSTGKDTKESIKNGKIVENTPELVNALIGIIRQLDKVNYHGGDINGVDFLNAENNARELIKKLDLI